MEKKNGAAKSISTAKAALLNQNKKHNEHLFTQGNNIKTFFFSHVPLEFWRSPHSTHVTQ